MSSRGCCGLCLSCSAGVSLQAIEAGTLERPETVRPAPYLLCCRKVSHSNTINLQKGKAFSVCMQLIVSTDHYLQAASPPSPLRLLKIPIVEHCACQNPYTENAGYGNIDVVWL